MAAQAIDVLLVENDSTDRAGIHSPDERAGTLTLHRARRLDEALDYLQDQKPDIVLLDPSLPDSNGIESVERLARVTGTIPIIVLTGAHDTVLGDKAVRAGAQDYLVKGAYDASGLERAIRYAIERHRARTEVRYLAHHDALTGLPNRTVLEDRLKQSMALSQRNDQLVALHCLDLDEFKEINDKLGQEVGDDMLKTVAKRLTETLRASDTAACLGGDEFAVVQTAICDREAVDLLAQRIIGACSEPFQLNGDEVFMGASLGIAVFPGDAIAADDLLRKADLALYQAKNSGGGAYKFFDKEMYSDFKPHHRVEKSLRQSLSKDEFTLYYQPIVNLKTCFIVGFEALIRWEVRDGQQILPEEFISTAEATGVIRPLGEWVLARACRDIAKLRDESKIPLTISVNLSPMQVRQNRLIAEITAALTAANLPPTALECEITETGVLKSGESDAHAILTELDQRGISIAIDDFGTGYSALSYLHHFPVSTIKIDRSFVSKLATSQDAKEIVRAIIGLGRNLRKTVIAEGVETKEQAVFLRNEGCELAQGYLFSRPLPLDELTGKLFEKLADI